jgi:hypothetical protein
LSPFHLPPPPSAEWDISRYEMWRHGFSSTYGGVRGKVHSLRHEESHRPYQQIEVHVQQILVITGPDITNTIWLCTIVNFHRSIGFDSGLINYQNSGHYPSSCLLFKTHLNSIGLFVPQRKHITSPLRAQQDNVICRFVTMAYYYNYLNFGYYPSSCILFKTQLLKIKKGPNVRTFM